MVEEVNRRRDELLRVVREPEDRAELYRDLLLPFWLELPPEAGAIDGEVYAVDSSDGVIELAGGGVIYVVRAASLSNKRDEVRKLMVDAFYPRSDESLSDYRKLAREHLEHLSALEVAQGLSSGDTILIDGSIFGRMSHVLKAIDIPGRQDFIIDYVEAFHELLATCMKRRVNLVGVAKDSRSSVLRQSLLIGRLINNLGKYDWRTQSDIIDFLKVLNRHPRKARSALRELRKELDKETEGILNELMDDTPDYKMILAAKVGAGYSHPLKLGVKILESGFVDILFSPEKWGSFIQSFIKTIVTDEEPEKEPIEERVREALKRMASYPPVGTLYVKFSSNEIPLKIDIVHPDIEGWEVSNPEPRLIYPMPALGEGLGKVTEVLGVLRALYAGLKNYNVLLTAVDKYVKIKFSVRELYKARIESLLGTLIQQSRGTRRVSFP